MISYADLSPRERTITEYGFHEAAHAAVGVIYGGTLLAAVVSGGQRCGEISGKTIFANPPGRGAEVAFAGPWSALYWRYGRPPTQAEIYGILDGAGSEDLAVLTAAGGIATGAGVVPLVQRCWPGICGLAVRLWRDGQIDHDDVLAALSLDERTAPMGLPAIRHNGAKPGALTFTLAA